MQIRNALALVCATVVLAALFFQVWRQGQAGPTGYLHGAGSAAAEAGYCLAALERAGEITRGDGDPRFEQHLDEAIGFWRGRVGGASGRGRVALAQDSNAPGVVEGVHLRAVIGDCADRASGFYGHHFSSMEDL